MAAGTGPVLAALGRAPQLYERVAERLAEDIATGALKAGGRLPSERDLARRLGVGRSSVREALAALALEGIVVTRPGSGTYVSDEAPALAGARAVRATAPPPDASPSALLEARLLIEPEVAAAAARRAQPDAEAEALLALMEDVGDPERPEARARWNDADRLFHRQIAVMAANPVLLAVADIIAGMMDEPLWQRLRDESVGVPGRMGVHMAEHRLIYEAVAGGDEAAARFIARHHLERVRRFMQLA